MQCGPQKAVAYGGGKAVGGGGARRFQEGKGVQTPANDLGIAGADEGSDGKRDFASFIDFKKAYDRVDRGKLWGCLKGMGIGGRTLAFMKAAYTDLSCDVKVGAVRSDLFEVSCGLRQGCILSPLLFSLFINSVIARLKEAEVGVKCGSKLTSLLLYADDAVIFAEDEKSIECVKKL